jgi:hypothetical protein
LIGYRASIESCSANFGVFNASYCFVFAF